MDLLASENIWMVYLGLLIGPLAQQDLAVVGAVGLSIANPQLTPMILLFLFIGLLGSDLFKYFIGYYARRHKSANAYADHPKIVAASEKMRDHPGLAITASRFIPLTRMASHVAAGFIRIPYPIYLGWAVFSALLYVGLIFVLFHMLGAVMGEKIKTYLPIVAIIIVAIIIIGLKIRRKLASRYETEG